MKKVKKAEHNSLHDFIWAFFELKSFKKIKRHGWKDMWIEYQEKDSNCSLFPGITAGHISLHYAPCERYPRGYRIPWTVSQQDLFAEDWEYKLEFV